VDTRSYTLQVSCSHASGREALLKNFATTYATELRYRRTASVASLHLFNDEPVRLLSITSETAPPSYAITGVPQPSLRS